VTDQKPETNLLRTITSSTSQRWRSLRESVQRFRGMPWSSMARDWGASSLRAAQRRATTKPSWEAAAFGTLIVIALGTRMWDVGGRALHYDEVLHAWYSWRFAEGMGYSHTPLTHGPFLFHSAAASFAVLGSSDVAVRLLPALFGTALVGLPWFLRKELGSYGALATAALLTVSPSILYFGRFVRNDIFMAVWAVLLVVIMWRYFERPRTGLLVGWVAVWALAYTTKETVFLLAGTFGLFLIILSTPALWSWVRGRSRLSDLPPAGDLLIVLGTISLPLWAPIVGLIQEPLGIILTNPDGNSPRVISGEMFRANVETGAPAGGAIYIAAFLVAVLAAISTAIGLLWDRRRWPLMVAVFVAIWLPLFTSLFTNWQGFFTGFWGSLGYWVAQHDVARAGQPWYYYLVGLLTYEFLIVVPGLIGGAFLLVKGTSFDRFISGWAVLTFLLFSYAGERMPWLLVGITVPFALVAGRTVGLLVGAALGARMAPAAFLGGLCSFVFLPIAMLRAIRSDSLLSDLSFWLALAGLIVTAAAVAGTALRLRPDIASAAIARALGSPRMRRSPLFAGAALGALTVVLVFTVFVAGRASYSYAGFERPTELLVYSQGGQEAAYAAECLSHIARDSGLGKNGLRIFTGESDNFAWQWRWYLRDYTNVQFRFLNDNPFEEPPDAHVVLMSNSVKAANEDRLIGFTRMGEINHLWWFPNAAYKGITPLSVVKDTASLERVQTMADYFIDRVYTGNMYKATGAIYVVNDLAHLAEGCTDLRATAPPPDAPTDPA
jgi:uncharacterized protein (TIGR03663 family)